MTSSSHGRPRHRALKRAAFLLLSLAIVAGAYSVARGLPGELIDRFSERGSASTLTDLHDVGQLQTAFNQAEGTPRLILLFSPT